MVTTASSWSLAVISGDRLLSVIKPLEYKSIISRAKVVLISIPWIIGFALYGPAIIVWDFVDPPEFKARDQCFAPFYADVVYNLVGLGLDFFLPYALVWIFYMWIFKRVRHQQRAIATEHTVQDEQRLRRIKKTARSLAILITCYGVTWIPFVLATVANYSCMGCVPYFVYQITYHLMSLNSAINPFIYPIMQEDFRKAFKRILLYPFKCGNQVGASG